MSLFKKKNLYKLIYSVSIEFKYHRFVTIWMWNFVGSIILWDEFGQFTSCEDQSEWKFHKIKNERERKILFWCYSSYQLPTVTTCAKRTIGHCTKLLLISLAQMSDNTFTIQRKLTRVNFRNMQPILNTSFFSQSQKRKKKKKITDVKFIEILAHTIKY